MSASTVRSHFRLSRVRILLLACAAAVCIVIFYIVAQSRSERSAQPAVLRTLPGRACGIVTYSYATDILGVENLERGYANERVYDDARGPSYDYYLDSCRYTDPLSSVHYIELFITQYSSNDIASQELLHDIPVVNEQQSIEASDFGADSAVVDSGVYYLRYGSTTVTISSGTSGGQASDMLRRELVNHVTKSLRYKTVI